MSGTQLSVSQGGSGGVTTLLDLSDDAETVQIGEQEKTTAAAAFLGCVSASAKNDKRLDLSDIRFVSKPHTIKLYAKTGTCEAYAKAVNTRMFYGLVYGLLHALTYANLLLPLPLDFSA